jgi:hypothetical protein
LLCQRFGLSEQAELFLLPVLPESNFGWVRNLASLKGNDWPVKTD